MARVCIGVDIGSTSVKVVEARKKGRTSLISTVASIDLPRGTVSKSRVKNQGALTAALKRIKQDYQFRTSQIAMGLTSQELIVNTAEFPVMSGKELRQAIGFELGDIVRFPFNSLEEVCYSYDVVSKTDTQQQVLVTACKRDLLDPFLSSAKDAGFEPLVVDVLSFALPRVLPEISRHCVIELGAQQSSIYVEIDGMYRVYRILPLGGRQITEGIMEAFATSESQAEALKKKEDIDFLLTNGTGSKGTLRAVIQQYIGGILQTLDFMRAQERVTNTSEIFATVYICGGTSLLKGFRELLQQELDIEVQVLDPFEHLELDGIKRPTDNGRFAGACALALRGLDER